VNETQIIYVGKHGNNSNSGLYIGDAKLTIANALTTAGTPGTEAAAVTIVILDDGEYDEDLTHKSYVNVFAPNATLKGLQTLAANMTLTARRFINDGNQYIVRKTSAGKSVVHALSEISSSSTAFYPVSQSSAGDLYVDAPYIYGPTAVYMSGTGRMFVRADYIEGFNNQGINCASAGELHVTARKIKGGTLHGAVQAQNGDCFVIADELEGGVNSYSVSSNGTLYLSCPKLTGNTQNLGKVIDMLRLVPRDTTWEDMTDWMTPTVAGENNWETNIGGTGSSVQLDSSPGSPSHPGIVRCGTGSTSSGYAGLGRSTQMKDLGGGELIIEALVYIPTNLSTSGERFGVVVGWGSDQTGSTIPPGYGVYFQYSDNVNGGNWYAGANTYGSTSNLDTGVAVAANTWYKLKIVIAADGQSAEFFVDDVSAGTISSNLPYTSSANMGPFFKIAKSVGTATRYLNVDYYYWKKDVAR